ncbi:SRPBCC family protein [soil metagenome]
MDETSTDIAAPPERVWALITDVTQMGRWSPECLRCTWLDGADGPEVGARFKGHNKRGLLRWSTISIVVEADEPEHFAFEVADSRMRWGYRFEPTSQGTRVTEYRREVGPKPAYVRLAYAARLLGRDPDAVVRSGMAETLVRLKAAAEAA